MLSQARPRACNKFEQRLDGNAAIKLLSLSFPGVQYGHVAPVVMGLTCGEVQKAKVSIDDSLLPQHQQGHLACCGLCGGDLHLPQQQQHLHCHKPSIMTHMVCTVAVGSVVL